MNKIDFKEALEVINVLDDKEKNKIPINVIENLKGQSNGISTDAVYRRDGNIVLSRNAKIILTYIYSKYLATNDFEKYCINQKLIENREVKSIIANKKFPKDKIENIKETIVENTVEEYEKEKYLIVKKETFFQKIVNKILNFFSK